MWNVELTTRPGAEHLCVLFGLGEKELNLVIKLPCRLDIDSEDSSDCLLVVEQSRPPLSLLSPMAIRCHVPGLALPIANVVIPLPWSVAWPMRAKPALDLGSQP